MFFSTKKELLVDEPHETVYRTMHRALAKIGKVTKEAEYESLRGVTYYGADRVTIQATFTPRGNGTHIALLVKCGDLWGVGSRAKINELLGAMALPVTSAPPATTTSAPAPVASGAQKMPGLWDMPLLDRAAYICVILLIAELALGGRIIGWKEAPIPPWIFWSVSALLGALAAGLFMPRGFRTVGVVGGGLGGGIAAAICVLMFENTPWASGLTSAAAALVSLAPGCLLLFLLVRLKMLIDGLLRPRRPESESAES